MTPTPPSSPTCWFSRNNSETVNAVTLAFFSIQEQFIRNFRAKFGIPYLRQCLDIRQNLEKLNFWSISYRMKLL